MEISGRIREFRNNKRERTTRRGVHRAPENGQPQGLSLQYAKTTTHP